MLLTETDFKKILLVAAIGIVITTTGWSIRWLMATSDRLGRIEVRAEEQRLQLVEMRTDIKALPELVSKTIRDEFERTKGEK